MVLVGGLAVGGWYAGRRLFQPKYELFELRVVPIGKSSGGFGTVDRMALGNLVVTGIKEKQDRWLVSFEYLVEGERKRAVFEVTGFNGREGKYVQFGTDPWPWTAGQEVMVHLIYSAVAGQTSRQRMTANLGEKGPEIIRDFGDEVISPEKIRARLARRNSYFTDRLVKVSSIN
jgi:hypothetical protein